jgi:PAS domain S-box-containing protein
MKQGIRTPLEHVEGALTAARMAWWELEFPSGALRFSKNKTDMLGYDAKDFVHFTHFTNLIHPDDHDLSMDAMRDHYEGRKEVYEVTYRIKASDGSYVTFLDKGRIVERTDQGFVVAGIVQKVG